MTLGISCVGTVALLVIVMTHLSCWLTSELRQLQASRLADVGEADSGVGVCIEHGDGGGGAKPCPHVDSQKL